MDKKVHKENPLAPGGPIVDPVAGGLIRNQNLEGLRGEDLNFTNASFANVNATDMTISDSAVAGLNFEGCLLPDGTTFTASLEELVAAHRLLGPPT